MSITRCRHLAVLVVFGCLPSVLPLFGMDVQQASPPPSSAQVQPYSDATYPQIVRISYAEGDVRVSRGTRRATWETAVTGLPLETGFNLVTGKGRAEVEFEDASILYLGENSALAFNDLRTTAGVPYTELALLSGTATLNLDESIAGESFRLYTPARSIAVFYPTKIYERVSSYLDAMVITPLKTSEAKLQTVTYSASGRVTKPSDPAEFGDWDNWVASRVGERSAAMTAMMKASGLTTPLPGMADMKDQGTFFPCAPYGTCWLPSSLPSEQFSAESPQTKEDAPFEAAQLSVPSQPAGAMPQPVGPKPNAPVVRDTFFPCPPTRVRSLVARDPITGRQNVLYSTTTAMPYDWAVCHAGSWVYHQHRYAWVAGGRRHHHCPVHWVKSGRTVAYVPIHPKDVPGKAPLNQAHGVFALTNKHSNSVEVARLDPSREVKLLNNPPKGFRNANAPVLARAANPEVQAHHLLDVMVARKATDVKMPGTRLSFDHRSQSFTVDKHDSVGLKGNPERAVVNNHINSIQARLGSVDGHGNYSTHSSGGSFGAGSTHSGGGGGGGSHSGGGSSGGGGGSHSGGGSSGGGGGSHGGGGSSGGGGGSHGGGGSSGGSSGGGGGGGGGGHR
jgi:FecR protein